MTRPVSRQTIAAMLAHRSTRLSAAVLAGAVALGGLIAFGARDAYPTTRVPLESGQAWVPSDQIGALTLLDGVAAQVVANVPVAPRGGDTLVAAQDGVTGFAVDQTAGLLTRIDPVSLRADPGLRPLGGAGRTIQIFAGTGILYVVDGVGGTVETYSPDTLKHEGPAVSVAVSSDYAAVVDSADRLWLLDGQTGVLTRFDGVVGHEQSEAFTPGAATIALGDGRPIITDTAEDSAYLIAPDGSIQATVPLGLAAADRIQTSGDPARSILLLTVSPPGAYESCLFALHTCNPPIILPADRGDALGAALAADGRVFIPDYTTGDVWLVDPAVAARPKPVPLLPPGTKYQLLSSNGLIFFNDPNSNQAGTIAPDGAVRHIVKYSSTVPTEATTTSTAAATKSSGPKQPTAEPDPTPGTPGPTPGASSGSSGTTGATSSAQPTTGPSGTASPSPAPVHIAGFTVSPSAPEVGDSVTVGADITGTRPDTWQWTITDESTGGIVALGGDPDIVHVFTHSGIYLVTLQVTQGRNTDESATTIDVAASAANLVCGETVTGDVTLSADLNCVGDGLIIGAFNITVDLGGHTITGNGTGSGISFDPDVDTTFSTVENGRISHFANGFSAGTFSPESPTIDAVTFADDGTGSGAAINLGSGSGGVIGISQVVVSQSSGTAFLADGSATLKVMGSAFSGGAFSVGGDAKIDLNLTDDSFDHAPVDVADNFGAQIVQNTFTDSAVHVMSSQGESITGNTFTGAVDALTLDQTGEANVSGNGFSGNLLGIVLDVGDVQDVANSISTNSFTGNGAGGILVNDTSSSRVLETISDNIASRNGNLPDGVKDAGGNPVEDAIHIYAPIGRASGIDISDNVTGDDAAYGIWSEPGTVTGAGNMSTGDRDMCNPLDLCTYG
jgi:Periplasmic copper-binding protein (NosD)